MEWETVIGLEVHAQLKTKSKIFSGASTAFGGMPNTQACKVDVALPGTLPVLNEVAVEMAIKFGLAIDAEINTHSIFARKNYFYPDLPKGYQISQFEEPIVGKGHLDIVIDEKTNKRVGITRAHLEEDAGKSLHEDFQGMTGIDLNRAGTPLLEIVSEPDMRSTQEAVAYLKTLHTLVKYLDICDGNMAEGSFRCDANVSIRPKGETKLGTRTEIKNINSFRFVEKALQYEIERQINIRESGEEIAQETRLYDANKNETRSMRSKEEANDYRYFPDPDLLPVQLEQSFIDKVKKSIPELPHEKRSRFVTEFAIKEYDANVLTANKDLAAYYEKVVELTNAQDPKLAANWILGELLGALNKSNLSISETPLDESKFAHLINRIIDNTISGKGAKIVFEALWEDPKQTIDDIIKQKSLTQVTDTGAIEKVIDEVIQSNPEQLAQYKAGKDKLFGFFVGQVMKATKGAASPKQVNTVLKQKLDS